MERSEWLWNELRDLFRTPGTYICRKEWYKWMSNTAFFVEELHDYVSQRRDVENAIIVFQRKVSHLKNLDLAKAGFAVSKAALEMWKESKTQWRKSR